MSHAPVTPVTSDKKNTDRSINEVVAEYKAAFGSLEFEVVRASDGLTLQTKGYVDRAYAFGISGEDFIRLGNVAAGQPLPTKGVIKSLLQLMRDKQ